MTIHNSKKDLKTAWVSRSGSSIAEKPWGAEKTWTGFNGVHGKILYVNEGKRTSLKFHRLKAEVLYLMKGSVRVLFGNESSFEDPGAHPLKEEVLCPGDTLLVQSHCPYRIIGLEDSEIIEIGNHRSDKPVRVLDDYGRASEDVDSLIEAVKEHI